MHIKGYTFEIFDKHKSKKLPFVETEKLYVVVCQYTTGKWGVADWWGIPCASTTYKTAQTYKKEMVEKAIKYGPWKEDNFKVIKMEFPK